jgi:hypothetical protein
VQLDFEQLQLFPEPVQPSADPPEENPATELKNPENLQEISVFTQASGQVAINERPSAIN